MSALFDFQSFLTVVLLFICTCTYYKLIYPGGLVQTTGCVALRALLGSLAPRGPRNRAQNETRRGSDCDVAPRGAPTPTAHRAPRRFKGLFWKAARIGGLRGRGIGGPGACASHRARPQETPPTCERCCVARGPPRLKCPSQPLLPPPLAHTGERLSPWVSLACIAMGFSILFA